jgi:hypothetical protein
MGIINESLRNRIKKLERISPKQKPKITVKHVNRIPSPEELAEIRAKKAAGEIQTYIFIGPKGQKIRI